MLGTLEDVTFENLERNGFEVDLILCFCEGKTCVVEK